jgi:DNA-nicking Smr family endonuclease|tara:strand:- start:3112 stop:3639 length:528 start_codon:yes stop_codon:yes gene_type:complete
MKKDDTKSFQQQMVDVKPLQANRVYLHKRTDRVPGIVSRREAAQKILSSHVLESVELTDQVRPRDILSYKQEGLEGRIFKNLRQGKLPIDSKLDLHRMTVMQAQLQISRFIRECVCDGIRVAIIIHGRGEGRERPALLKSWTNYWLKQIDSVLAFHSAQPQHGGTGAIYLLLDKK